MNAARAIKANDHRVEEISDERATGDGIWFYLKPGWIWGEVHFIHEDTVGACRDQLKLIAPCACKECNLLILRAGRLAGASR